jgi:MHS family citrate/tricarballylate:H+ symporter-like MFS transporter
MIPFVIEFLPQRIRTAGFSLSFSLATTLFGGFTPAIATYLIQVTGNRAAPTLWLSFGAAISLVAALAAGHYVNRGKGGAGAVGLPGTTVPDPAGS